jgi:hypothetical protein
VPNLRCGQSGSTRSKVEKLSALNLHSNIQQAEVYSAFVPADLSTFSHFLVSLVINSANAAVVIGAGTLPSWANRACVSES